MSNHYSGLTINHMDPTTWSANGGVRRENNRVAVELSRFSRDERLTPEQRLIVAAAHELLVSLDTMLVWSANQTSNSAAAAGD